jgi:energy-coupling factor transporter ATP-binding protein EcfA2
VGLSSLLGRDGEEQLAQAGELLGVEAIYRTGLVVTSDGALARILHVLPANPLVLSGQDRANAAAAFCHLIGRLRPGQSLQYYVQARPIALGTVLATSRREVETWAGPPPARGALVSGRGRDRWRLYAGMEQSLQLHAAEQAAVQFDAYVVVPYLPPRRHSQELLAQLRGGKAAAVLERDLATHRRVVRQSIAHVDAIRAELDGMDIPSRLLSGVEVAELLWARCNPTSADRGRHGRFRPEILGELDAVREVGEARAVALRLREAIAQSALDFGSDPNHAAIERDLEQTIYAANTADGTYFGWLMGAMTGCRQPFTLSVHVHALDRQRERQRAKLRYRRHFALNREREARGRPPDFDAYQAEHEHERLLAEMSGHDRSAIYALSVYHSIRAPGPRPDVELLQEAVSHAADHITSASDCRVDAGKHQQRDLWRSTLPLGVDVARRARKYATRNVGDTTPLLGVGVGSPEGIPLAFTQPGRTLERWNPYDREHANPVCLVTGRSGSGKTVLCNTLLGRAIAHGARGFVVDRAGHFKTLTRLIDGAQHLDIGADDSEFHLNPWDVEDVSHVGREKVAFLIGLHETMLSEGLSTLERAQLGSAIRAVYERCDAEGLDPREALLKDELDARARAEQVDGSAEIAFTLRQLAERLSEFCGEGAYAHIADRLSSDVADAPLLVFDTKACPEAVLQPVIFTVLEFITRTAKAHRDAHRELAAGPDAPLMTGCSVAIGDEFWSVMGNASLGSYANDLARRARHIGLTLVIASQQLSDFDNEYGLALLRNSTQQFFLGQHQEELRFIDRAVGLSENEIGLIARLKTVKGSHSQLYWINGTRGRGVCNLPLGPIEYWSYSSEPTRDAPLREQKIAEHNGDAWAAILDLADYRRAAHAVPQEAA